MIEPNTIGRWLRLKRKAHDLTREALADRLGYSAATIRKIEAEERRPSAQIVERLVEIFQIPPDERRAFLQFARGDWKSAPGGVAEEPPWWTPTQASHSNLPAVATSLVGRQQEINLVCGYLLNNDIRLVTLIGPPGIGKTRLSIAAAHAALPDFPASVFFVALAPLEDPDLLALTIAQTLGYVDVKNISTKAQLLDGIGEKHMLLVLDNCEHLIDDVASLVSDLLSACHQLKILATSRESLRIAGEWLFGVPALDVPKDRSSVDMQHAAQFPALTLFSERARAARSDFALDVNNIAAVSAICAQLDGLPLAIELIAARIRFMSPQALLEHLTGPFILSADGMRTASARQKTLNHAIGWSYKLLSAEEQSLFSCLSVFSGGFTLQAAEAIFSSTATGRSISGLVTSLFDKSLLQRGFDDVSGEARFSMLVTIQQFAMNCLRQAGKGLSSEGLTSEGLASEGLTCEVAEKRNWHSAYFLHLAEQADHEIHGPRQIEWLERLYADRDNLRAALEWMIESGQTEAALKMARSLSWFWWYRSELNESRRWFERVVALSDAPLYPQSYAEALSHFANHTWYQAKSKEARSLVEQALAVARLHQDRHNTAQALMFLGLFLADEHAFTSLCTTLEESRVLFHELGDEWEESAHLVLVQAYGPFLQQDWAASLALHAQALAGFRKFGDIFFQTVCLRFVGHLQARLGDVAHGMAALKEALVLGRQLGSSYEIAAILWAMGQATQSAGNFSRALRLYCATKNIYESIGAWQPVDEAKLGNALATCRAGLDEWTFAAALEQGRAMTINQAVPFAFEE